MSKLKTRQIGIMSAGGGSAPGGNYELGIRISGKVIHGEEYGRILGFPTANLDRRSYSRRNMNIRLGVWAGSAVVQATGLPNKAGQWPALQKPRPAAIVIGPIDKNGLPKIEAHLLNFKGNLYGKKLIISLNKFIRPFKKFKNETELKKQIRKDIINIEKINLYARAN